MFAGGLECFEEQPSSAFTGHPAGARPADRRRHHELLSTAATALVTADVTWTPAGPATTTRLVSKESRCRTTRTSVPVEVTGSVVVAVEGRAPMVLEHVPGAYDGLRSEVTRCAVRGPGA